MSAAESTKTLAGRPWPNGDPATWVHLDDLPTPPEVTREIEERCRRNGWRWRWWYRKSIESITHELKQAHYFPGQEIVFKFTPRGWLILLAAAPFAPEIEAFLNAMPSEDRGQVATVYVLDPSDSTTRLPSSYTISESRA